MFDAALSDAPRKLLAAFDHQLRSLKFYLAGDAGLALQLGHRRVKHLEFFTGQPFDPDALSRSLKTRAGYQETLKNPGMLTAILKRVRLSFRFNPVHLRHPLLEYQTVMVADWRDILADAFKILSENPRRTVFYDLYACLTLRSLDISAAIATVRRRYGRDRLDFDQVLKNLDNFDSADREPKLDLLKPLPWETVKDFFRKNLPKFERHLVVDD